MTEPGDTKQDLPILEFSDQAGWERWLEQNHQSPTGVWLKFAKKDAPVTTVTFPQALEVALCYGWIDGQVSRYDEIYYLQRFTARRPRSKWSQINRAKVNELIKQGRMKPPGQAQIDAAMQDGRWDAAYEPQSRATVPQDFQRELDRSPAAKAFFETLRGSSRYAFLYRLHQVTDPERRAKRIAGYIATLSERKTL